MLYLWDVPQRVFEDQEIPLNIQNMFFGCLDLALSLVKSITWIPPFYNRFLKIWRKKYKFSWTFVIWKVIFLACKLSEYVCYISEIFPYVFKEIKRYFRYPQHLFRMSKSCFIACKVDHMNSVILQSNFGNLKKKYNFWWTIVTWKVNFSGMSTVGIFTVYLWNVPRRV